MPELEITEIRPIIPKAPKYNLSETLDTSKSILEAHTDEVISGTLNFNKGNNIVILDGQAKTYRGLEGDDTYFVSQLLPKSGKVSITDTEGSNLIQLPSNTYIDKTLFTKNAARLTLEDGREITISGADKFSYNVGGNITDGTKGTDLTFTEFAESFVLLTPFPVAAGWVVSLPPTKPQRFLSVMPNGWCHSRRRNRNVSVP